MDTSGSLRNTTMPLPPIAQMTRLISNDHADIDINSVMLMSNDPNLPNGFTLLLGPSTLQSLNYKY